MTPARPANRLAREKSPYLRQHAHNPVEWYPWGEEAFAAARAADKPIFLSIGYSTCYWCHVMEKESFESDAIAALLNASFIAVKVDREERPDVDALYMSAVQAMTGQGGWPMSVFLTPAGEPFWCGTYFPPADGHGRPGFATVLRALAAAWTDRRDDVVRTSRQLTEAIQKAAARQEPPSPMPEDVVQRAVDQLARSYDSTHGGFGTAPKFPRPHALSLLLRHWDRTRDAQALAMVEATLTAIARGGVYDQLGGGVHRYATDREWMIPHFEKMLYDQALLARVAVDAHRATGAPAYASLARSILDYVLRDLLDAGGAFFSAEDAGEVGREGEFYVWRPEDCLAVLAEADLPLALARWGIAPAGNFEDNTTVLHAARPIDDIAREFGLTTDDAAARLTRIARELLAARGTRPRPHRDEKVLTDWNGLMIGAFAAAGAYLDEPRFVDAAIAAAHAIGAVMGDARSLVHRYCDGEAAIPAFLDDYACLASGLIELFEATSDPRWLHAAMQLADEMIAQFWDEAAGEFRHTSARHEALVARVRDAYDGATPSGQSMAAWTCARLARWTHVARYEACAEGTFAAFGSTIAAMPSAYTAFLCAWDEWAGPSEEVVIAGSDGRAELLRAARRAWAPRRLVVDAATDAGAGRVPDLVPFVRGRTAPSTHAVAYVCRDSVCSLPLRDVRDLETELARR